ncbi:hypothetical protein ACROSR_01700 [Roseovarius tibetensis]|uniref:hypothetical protein n=1 Tax=Roseovarius tibetensis TaxID=2685897 RepID=UPI003D7FE09E
MAHKIATCTYCGTRAALVLDRARHELTCASCGAPLHDMKALPKAKVARTRASGPPGADPRQPRGTARPMTLPRQSYEGDRRHSPPPRPRKRRKGLGRRVMEEIWDVVEDIFD